MSIGGATRNAVAQALMKRGGATRTNASSGPNSPSNWYTDPGGMGVMPPSPIAPTGSPVVAMPERNTVANIQTMQDLAAKGVQGYGDMLGVDFRKDVGNLLGGLNRIGAIRSGAVQAGVGDLMDTYGRRVGDYASMATRDAMGLGLQETEGAMNDYFRNRQLTGQETNDAFTRGFQQSEANREQYNYDRELRERDRANKSKKKSGILGAIGGILGGVGGFFLGGPGGAIAGASAGSKIGSGF